MYKRQRKTLALMLANNSGVSRKSELLSRTSLYEDFTYSDTLDSRITATRASTKTYFDSTGTLQTAAVNEFPREYDPFTLVCRGRSFWEARTNLLTYSQEFDNAAWTKVRSSVTANATTAPDGTVTADKLVEDATATNTHYTNVTYSVSSGTSYTLSFFAKAAERSVITLSFATQFPANSFCDFNLSSGATVVGSGLSGSSITQLPNGWYRCSISATASASAVSTIVCYMNNGGVTYTGDGTSGLYIWGAQLEVGATPTPYIPTTSASVTRAADVVSMTGTNFSSWYNQTEGTFLATYNNVSANTGGVARRIVAVSDGTTSERLVLSYGGSAAIASYFVTDGGVTQVNVTTILMSASNSLAAAYKANDFAVSYGGETSITDTSGTLPTPNSMYIGYSEDPVTTNRLLNGWISRITYWPSRLPNTDLQVLSRST